jgi:hypothetical protein
MGGVPWPESRVQVRQTTKHAVVQRCGLTSDRKDAPRPPAPAPPPQKSTKLHFHGRKCGNHTARPEHMMRHRPTRSFWAIERIFRGSAETSSPGSARSGPKSTKKLWRSPKPCSAERVCRCECRDAAPLSGASVRGPHFCGASAQLGSALSSSQCQAFWGTADERGRA